MQIQVKYIHMGQILEIIKFSVSFKMNIFLIVFQFPHSLIILGILF